MADAPTAPAHRAGVVALLGRPNAGKSTLLNRLLGEKLAIVTAKPQTTRSCIRGILTLPDAQLVLVDTPGLHGGTRPLNVALNEQAEEAGRDADAAALLVDTTRGWEPGHAALLGGLAARGTPLVVVGTKSDLASAAPWPADAPSPLRVSARTGEGVDALRAALVALLPHSPPLYPDDVLSDRSLRFLVAELVREAAFDALSQEVPYALAVEIEEFDESDPGLARIRANLLLERASQKQIAVGKGGAVIKRIGTEARREIEALLGRRVYLSLWVKVEPKWARRPKRLKSLGYC
jgi:GTP-binding protein Era